MSSSPVVSDSVAQVDSPRQAPLVRSLGVVAVTCLIVGQIVGIGIFLTPVEMARGLGATGLVYAMWLVAGFMALTGALCYGELASRFPEAGGAYVFLRRAWGERVAFLYGWKCLLVMDPGISAALAVGFADYVAYLTPLSTVGRKTVAIVAILVLALITALGTRLAAGTLVTITTLKLGLLALIVVLGLTAAPTDPGGAGVSWTRYSGSPALLPALAGSFVAAFFSFGGWWDAARMAGEVRNPERTLPRAFILGITVITAVYILTSAVFMRLVPNAESSGPGAFAARVGERIFGPVGGTVLAVVVIISVLGSLAAVMLSTPRVYLALARDGLFPARLARLHPRTGTPLAAILVQAILATLLVALGTFTDIVAYFVFVTIAFIAASVATLYRLPPSSDQGFRTPARRITPAIFVGLCIVLLGLLLAGKPLQALLGLLVVSLGGPVHGLLRRAGMLGTEDA